MYILPRATGTGKKPRMRAAPGSLEIYHGPDTATGRGVRSVPRLFGRPFPRVGSSQACSPPLRALDRMGLRGSAGRQGALVGVSCVAAR